MASNSDYERWPFSRFSEGDMYVGVRYRDFDLIFEVNSVHTSDLTDF